MFGKELRVAGRQRRYYLLRFGYICLLILFIVYVWLAAVRVGGTGSALVLVSRMPEAGKRIVTSVIWFQFLAAQFLAVVLLSGAVSGEVRQRTLEAVLVTPISGLQIVVGKLLSKLLQPVLLLAVSLPLLAVVRVFGGVSWDYVVSAFCITLVAMLFAGSLSLLLSVTDRQPHHVATTTVGWCLILWGGVPILLSVLSWAGHVSRRTVAAVLVLTNPFAVLVARTSTMLGVPAPGAAGSWAPHCLILLAATAAVLLAAVWRVRRVRLASILVGSGGTHSRRSQAARKEADGRLRAHTRRRRAIRRVEGAPIVWKELCRPLFSSRLRAILVVGFLIVAVVVMTVALIATRGPVGVSFLVMGQFFQLLFIVRLAASAGGAITREKEARTWPLLLATPLESKEIVRGKAVGVFRWNLCLLIPCCLLYLLGFAFSPADVRDLVMLVVFAGTFALGMTGSILFLLGLGLYLSVRLKTTTAAVAATLGLYVAPRLFCCGGWGPLFLWSGRALGPTGGPGYVGLLIMPLLAALGSATIYGGLGCLFARAAVGRLRRNVFE